MEIPHRAARPALSSPPPEIYVHQDSTFSSRFRPASRSHPYNSVSSPATIPGPMSIPNARDPVPPPLPPPRNVSDIAHNGSNGRDIAWEWANGSHGESRWNTSSSLVHPNSSLYGDSAVGSGVMGDRFDHSRRSSSTSTVKSDSRTGTGTGETHYPRIVDEGYASLSGTSIGSNKSVLLSHLLQFVGVYLALRTGQSN